MGTQHDLNPHLEGLTVIIQSKQNTANQWTLDNHALTLKTGDTGTKIILASDESLIRGTAGPQHLLLGAFILKVHYLYFRRYSNTTSEQNAPI